MVDRKVRGLKAVFFAVMTLFDRKGRPNGSAASVNYYGRGSFKLPSNAYISEIP